MIWPAMLGTLKLKSFQVDAVTFDGSNDWTTRGADLSGNADSKLGIASFWAKWGQDGGYDRIQYSQGDKFTILREAANKVRFYAGVDLLDINTSAILVAAGWKHYLASWSLATSTTHLYVSDVSDNTVVQAVNSNLDYTVVDHSIGADTAGAGKMTADIAEFYLAFGQYLDFSVEANRRKFISSNLKPVDLSPDGSGPTGTSPIIYFSVRPGDAATVFATNKGTGGNFSITGALALAATSPSD